jgi:hypothetical protein
VRRTAATRGGISSHIVTNQTVLWSTAPVGQVERRLMTLLPNLNHISASRR